MRRFIASFILLLPLSGYCQSPNLSGAITKLEASDFQTRSEKNQNNGYPGLTGTMINPAMVFPGFSGASSYTLWVKGTNSLLSPVNSLNLDPTGISIDGIRIGAVNGSQLGISSTNSSPLFLKAGSTSNKVYVSYGQSIGGVNSDGTGYQWSISTSGIFGLNSGTFNGSVDFAQNTASGVGQLSGSNASLRLDTPGISVSSGDFTFTNSSGGIIVPSNASESYPTRALNVTAANAIYAKLSLSNTWSGLQTFTSVSLPSSSLGISNVSGLQGQLDSKFPINGSASATGNINMGGYKITNVGSPTLNTDVVTLFYLNNTYSSTSFNSIVTTGGTPISATSSGRVITISMSPANGSQNGYLSLGDWTTFNSKQTAITAVAPLTLTTGTLSIREASSGTSGVVSISDYSRFSASSASIKSDYANPVVSPATVVAANASLHKFSISDDSTILANMTGSLAGTRTSFLIHNNKVGDSVVTFTTHIRTAETLTISATSNAVISFANDGTDLWETGRVINIP